VDERDFGYLQESPPMGGPRNCFRLGTAELVTPSIGGRGNTGQEGWAKLCVSPVPEVLCVCVPGR